MYDHELSLLRLACDPDYATFTEEELCRKLAAIGLARGPAGSPAPTYRPGDRVLFRATLGALPATVRDANSAPDGCTLYAVELHCGPFPRMLALASQLRPIDEADMPFVVPAVS